MCLVACDHTLRCTALPGIAVATGGQETWPTLAIMSFMNLPSRRDIARTARLMLLVTILLATGSCTKAPTPAVPVDIPVEPAAGSYLTGYWGESTNIMLTDVSVSFGDVWKSIRDALGSL